jgi:hypothetical protein
MDGRWHIELKGVVSILLICVRLLISVCTT